MENKKSRRALGKGLSKLIPIESDVIESGGDIADIDVTSVKVNPYQPRIDFDDEEIKNLADSIKNQGLLQPIVVRKKQDYYEIISGERRFRAHKYLKKDKISAIVKKDISDTEMLEMALVENIQRENLNDIEVALSYQKLLFDCGLSHKDLSERVGKGRSSITNTLRLLKLPEKIQGYLRNGDITSGHARALLSIQDEKKQESMAERIINEKLSVRDIEALSGNIKNDDSGKEKNYKTKLKNSKKIKSSDPEIESIEEKLRYKFGTSVSLNINSSYKGKIEISCYSKDDLNRVLEILNS